MDCPPAIGLLIFQIVCMKITAIRSDQKQQLADTLNSLLKFPGWSDINDRAIYRNAAGQMQSFTGRDLYTFDLDLNEEYDLTMEDRIVHVKNVDTKYDMIVRLLGCVYTKAMLTFLKLTHANILKCRKARVQCRANAGNRVTKHFSNREIPLTSEQRILALKEEVDFDRFKTVVDMALGQLESHSLMLDSMSTALRFLIGLVPSEQMYNELVLDLLRIAVDIDGITNLPAYISIEVPSDSTIGNDDEKSKRKLKIFSDKVFKTTDTKVVAPLIKFKNNHCILPDNERVEEFKKRYRDDVLIEEMKTLENDVFTRYYTNLGFIYDHFNQATTLAAPENFQNKDDDEIIMHDADSLGPNVTLP